MKPPERKLRLHIRIPALILIAAYLIFAPAFMTELDRNVYREWLEPDKEPYGGVITVWHIVSFRPYGGSVGSWLEDIGRAVEKEHFGVYFDVVALTAADAAVRFARGDRADVYSFADSAAVPSLAGEPREFLRSGYVLVINAEYAERRSMEEPEDGLVTREWLMYAIELMEFNRGKTPVAPMAGSAAAAAACGLPAEIPDVSVFKSAGASMAITDIRTWADIARAFERGALFETWCYPLTGYTDLVQYIAAAADAEAEMQPYIDEFLTLVFDGERQAKLCALGQIPAVLPEEPEYPEPIIANVADLITGSVFDLVTLP